MFSASQDFVEAAPRKKTDENESASSPFSIRLTEQQRSRLKQNANGKPLGVYVRGLIFEDDGSLRQRRTGKIKDPEALAHALASLGQSRLPQNLNQISKAANLGVLEVSPALCRELSEACAHVREIRELLLAGLGTRKVRRDP